MVYNDEWNKGLNKEWVNYKDILNVYPISRRTYYERIKKIEDESKTRFVNSKKGKKTREIHISILDSLFGNIKIPNNEKKLSKWVKVNKWDFFIVSTPPKVYVDELKSKMEFIVDLITKSNRKVKFILYYNIEQNNRIIDVYYHSHILIKVLKGELDKSTIEENFSLIMGENNSNNTITIIRKYDYKTFQNRGINYNQKNLSPEMSGIIKN
jgi:hypothetical protein